MSPAVFFSLLLLSFWLCSAAGNHRKLMMTDTDAIDAKYVAVIDAGSSGSRVRVYLFNRFMHLNMIDNKYDFSIKTNPGLSAYPNEPEKAVQSLAPLLKNAIAVIPQSLRRSTPVTLGATAGLRNLPPSNANNIIAAVREFLKGSGLEYKDEWVRIISGNYEGIAMWVATNYLLGNIGKLFSETVGVIELGGASVQMVYALSEEAALKAPQGLNDDEKYVSRETLNNTAYDIYSHSYLNYGIDAARALFFQIKPQSHCLNAGYSGKYNYNGNEYDVSASPEGSSFEDCSSEILDIIKTGEPCQYQHCTFGGIWSGGGGEGRRNLLLTASFFYRAQGVGLIKTDEHSKTLRPQHYRRAASRVCSIEYAVISSKYPDALSNQFLCFDLAYQYTLLVHGFGLGITQKMVVFNDIYYKGAYIQATWALGNAIHLLSSESTSILHKRKMLRYWEKSW